MNSGNFTIKYFMMEMNYPVLMTKTWQSGLSWWLIVFLSLNNTVFVF